VFGTQLIMVQLVRGTLGALVPLIEQVIADNPIPVFTGVLALAHADADRFDEARRILDRFASSSFELPLDVTWLTAVVACAEAASACGDTGYAGPLLEHLAPFSDQWLCTDVSASGPLSRTIGDLLTIVGRYDEAERCIAAARTSCEHAGALFFGSQSDLSWGRLMVERDAPGDRDRARRALQHACHVSAARGYATVERRALGLLRRLDG
jgi:hypothetical protein